MYGAIREVDEVMKPFLAGEEDGAVAETAAWRRRRIVLRRVAVGCAIGLACLYLVLSFWAEKLVVVVGDVEEGSSSSPGATDAEPLDFCDHGAYRVAAELCDSPLTPVLDGADVVAYRTLHWAAGAEDQSRRDPHVQGAREFSRAFEGFVFWFSTAANRAAFDVSPRAYVPAAGGFCAFALSGRDPHLQDLTLWALHRAPVDPDVWHLSDDGTLSVFRGDEAMALYLADEATNAAAVRANWKRLAVGPDAPCDAALFNTECFFKKTPPSVVNAPEGAVEDQPRPDAPVPPPRRTKNRDDALLRRPPPLHPRRP